MEENKIVEKEFEIINLAPNMGTIYKEEMVNARGEKKSYYVLDFGSKEKGDLCELPMLFKSDKHVLKKNTSSSCGCTDPSVNPGPEENSQIVVVRFDGQKILKSGVSKVFTLYSNTLPDLKFNLYINR